MINANQSKSNVKRRVNNKLLYKFFCNGIYKMLHSWKAMIVAIVFLSSVFIFYFYRFEIVGFDGILALMYSALYKTAYMIICILGIFAFITLLGMPRGYYHYYDSFIRIDCCNRLGEPPALIDVQSIDKLKGVFEWTFECPGIPLSYWLDHQETIESALNVHIVDIFPGKDSQHIVCTLVPGDHQLKSVINWQNKFLSDKNFELVLGDSYTGTVSINLITSPHLLIGGATGSGKTVLMRCLLAQCIAKGALVIVADFKKVDFKKIWHKTCTVITDEDDFIELLKKVVSELEHRQRLFQASDCSDLEEYNFHRKRKLPRIVIGCDEVAELLDSKGIDKAGKAKIDEISKAFSTIARQGRAFGISLILGTQRASVDVIPPHVKSNLTYTTCGRASSTLSVIILDNGDAADKIPKNAKGRFLDNEGRLYQAYYFKDSQLSGLIKEVSVGKRKRRKSSLF